MIEALKKALQELLSSIARTVVPIAVASIVAFLVRLGLPVDEGLAAAISNGVAALAGALAATLYYVVVRLLERVYPWASKLLGSNQTPVGYAPTKEVAENEVVAAPVEDLKVASDTFKAVQAAKG